MYLEGACLCFPLHCIITLTLSVKSAFLLFLIIVVIQWLKTATHVQFGSYHHLSLCKFTKWCSCSGTSTSGCLTVKSKQQGLFMHFSFCFCTYSWMPKLKASLTLIFLSFCRAYDRAAIRFNGPDAVTNFDSSSYDGDAPLPPEIEKDGTTRILYLFWSSVH